MGGSRGGTEILDLDGDLEIFVSYGHGRGKYLLDLDA